MSFFAAGYETTATALQFFVYSMAIYPDIQDKVSCYYHIFTPLHSCRVFLLSVYHFWFGVWNKFWELACYVKITTPLRALNSFSFGFLLQLKVSWTVSIKISLPCSIVLTYGWHCTQKVEIKIKTLRSTCVHHAEVAIVAVFLYSII